MEGNEPLNTSGNLNTAPVVDPTKISEGYSAVLYNNKKGLPTSEVNAIAQTDDGFLWIGSYSGLLRYDGSRFERFESVEGISNARCLFVDSKEWLWIGTNDAGVFRVKNGKARKTVTELRRGGGGLVYGVLTTGELFVFWDGSSSPHHRPTYSV